MKKLICMVLVVAMALSMGITSAFADVTYDGSVTVAVTETASSYVGGKFYVDVTLTQNDGVYGMLLPIEYDTRWLELAGKTGCALTDWQVGTKAVWDNGSTWEDEAKDYKGTDTPVLRLWFKVLVDPTNITDPDYTITVGNAGEAYGYNADPDKMPQRQVIVANSCTVTVGDAPDYSQLTYKTGKSLELKDRVYVDYKLQVTAMPENFSVEDSLFVYVWTGDAAAAHELGSQNKICEFTVDGSDPTLYYAQSDGIAAKNVRDAMYAVLYLKKADGSLEAIKDIGSYNVVTYCEKQSSSSDTDLVNLCAALLAYGDAASTYFNK